MKELRRKEKKNEILVYTGRLFDISKIVKRETEEMPLIVMQSLQKYSDLAKRTGNLNELVEFDDIIEEYELFSKRVSDIAPQYVPKVQNTNSKNLKAKTEYNDRYDQVDYIISF